MAYTPHTLLTFGGTLGTGANAEIWQAGVRIAQKSGTGTFTPLDDLTGYLNAITGGLTTMWHSPSFAVASTAGAPAAYAVLSWAKVANIGANGKYSGTVDSNGGPNPVLNTSVGGTGISTVASMPGFLSLAVSWHTASPSKWGRHGRIYAPLTFDLSAAGSDRVSSTCANNALTWGKLLLTNISKPSNTGGNFNPVRPVVASNHAGEIFEINEVRVGDVVDVQRRRKGKLKETYVKSAWS